MANRVRARGRFIRPPKKTLMWIGLGVGDVVLTGSTTTLVATLGAGVLLLRPFTIMRSRMDIFVLSDQEAADEVTIGAYGEIVVTAAAAGVGVTALPNPSDASGDPDADWFIWQGLFASQLLDSASGLHPTNVHFIVDSKAMRKVGPDDEVATLVDIENATGMRLVSKGRQLIQLH